MNKTQNYQLNQWEADDRVLRTDFNADNAKIDAALSALSSGKGNCEIEIGSYEGDGSLNRTITITASFKPKLFVVVGEYAVFMFQGASTTKVTDNTATSTIPLTWSGNSVSWKVEYNYISKFLNETGTHYYVALG